MGAAWLVSIAYLDPGNLETDLQGGAQFGYALGWVLLWASLLGILVQILSLRLGIISQRNLAQMCRDEYPVQLRWVLWFFAELMIVASDVPEVRTLPHSPRLARSTIHSHVPRLQPSGVEGRGSRVGVCNCSLVDAIAAHAAGHAFIRQIARAGHWDSICPTDSLQRVHFSDDGRHHCWGEHLDLSRALSTGQGDSPLRLCMLSWNGGLSLVVLDATRG